VLVEEKEKKRKEKKRIVSACQREKAGNFDTTLLQL